jgi:MFS family permease
MKLTFKPLGLFTGYFFGGLADKYGRKPIAFLDFTGEALAVLWTPFICSSNSFIKY